jgi:hypothetical protein
MKRTKYLLVILIGVLLSACGNDFLNVNPPNKLSNQTFWKTKKDADLALVGCYNGWEGAINVLFGDAISDNLYEHSTYGYRLIGNGSANATNLDIHGSWASPYAADWWEYNRIRKYNTFLANIDKVKMDPKMKKEYKAEVRFLRAYDYFNKVMYYGAVPLITKVTPPSYKPSRTSVDSVEDFVLSELESISKILPVENNIKSGGHVTAGAALALKARLELYLGKYKDAMKDAKAVIDEGVYKLYPNYRKLFLPESDPNKEAILSINQVVDDYSNKVAQYAAPGVVGWTASTVSKSLVDTYEMTNGLPITNSNSGYDPDHPFKNRDPRLQETIAVPGSMWNGHVFVPLNKTFEDGSKNPNYHTIGNGARSGYGIKKYIPQNLTSEELNNYGKNFYVIRLAGVYLIYAEGAAKTQTHENLGLHYLNLVRKRAGMPPDNALTMKGVKYERRVELALEGLRYFDIKRWKIGKQTLDGEFLGSRHGKYSYKKGEMVWDSGYIKVEERHFHPNRNYLLPIPQSELDANPNMKQNPGY